MEIVKYKIKKKLKKAMEKIKKARIEHICCECHGVIRKQNRYASFSEKTARVDNDDIQIGIEYINFDFCLSCYDSHGKQGVARRNIKQYWRKCVYDIHSFVTISDEEGETYTYCEICGKSK